MLEAYIPEKYQNNIWFYSELKGKELLLKVLTQIARHGIVIDDPVMAADSDIYHCHSRLGDFNVFYDGDIDIWAPTNKMAVSLLPIFN